MYNLQLLEDVYSKTDYKLTAQQKTEIAEATRPQLQEDMFLRMTGRETLLPETASVSMKDLE